LKVIEKSLNFNLLALDKMHFIFCTHYQLDVHVLMTQSVSYVSLALDENHKFTETEFFWHLL